MLYTSKALQQLYGTGTRLYFLELASEQNIAHLAGEIECLRVDVLVNNAGFGYNAYFQQGLLERYLEMIQVHISATMRLTKAVLPQMLERDGGTVINVASDAACVAAPRNAVYSGSKAFIKQFTEGLYLDLRSFGSRIKVQALCPGLTRTDLQLKMGMPREKQQNHGFMHWQEPQAVVSKSFRCLEKGKPVCICGGAMGMLEVALAAALPKELYYRLILKLFPNREL